MITEKKFCKVCETEIRGKTVKDEFCSNPCYKWNEQFKRIWESKVRANEPWRYGAEREATIKLYRSKLKKFNPDIIEYAVDSLLDTNEEFKRELPAVGVFLEYCRKAEFERQFARRKQRERIKFCPCCNNSTFLVFIVNGQRKAFDCECYQSLELDKRTQNFKDCGLNKCDSVDCQNPKRQTVIEVPKHSYSHFKRLLSNCDLRPSIQETMESYYERNEKQILDKTGIEIKGVGD